MKLQSYIQPVFITLLLLMQCSKTRNEFDASGTFEATEIIVSSEANGKIMKLDIEEGQELNASDTVGYVDSMQLYLKKMQLLTNVRAVQSKRPDISKQIAAIEQQIITARNEKSRIENLLKANAANQKQLDDVNAQITILEKQLDAQMSTLSSTNRGIGEESSALSIQVAQLEDQIQKCKIINPITGTVLAKYAQQSEITTLGKPIYKIADMNNMILRAYITASQLTGIKIGQSVRVFADFGEKDEKEYKGTVTWISSKSEFTPKTIQTRDERANLVYAVKIAVKNDDYLKIGMYGSVLLEAK